MTTPAPGVPGALDLTTDELREVTRFVVGCAARVQDVFAQAHPEDPRVGAAIDAARAFASGGPRIRWLRTAAVGAHRAAKDASSEPVRLAARAAGDAAASAYLHPIASADQVGHILRAAACATRIAELTATDPAAALASAVEDTAARATPVLVDVLCRYPAPPPGRNRVEELMAALDTALRTTTTRRPGPRQDEATTPGGAGR